MRIETVHHPGSGAAVGDGEAQHEQNLHAVSEEKKYLLKEVPWAMISDYEAYCQVLFTYLYI